MPARRFETPQRRTNSRSNELITREESGIALGELTMQKLQKAAKKASAEKDHGLSANAFKKAVFGSKTTRRQMGEQYSRLQRYEDLMQKIKSEGESSNGKSVPFAVASSHNRIKGTFVGVLHSFSAEEFEPVRRGIQMSEDETKWTGTMVLASLKMKSVGSFGDYSLEHMTSRTHLSVFETSLDPESTGGLDVRSLGSPAIFIGSRALSEHKNDVLAPVSSQIDWMLAYTHFDARTQRSQEAPQLALV